MLHTYWLILIKEILFFPLWTQNEADFSSPLRLFCPDFKNITWHPEHPKQNIGRKISLQHQYYVLKSLEFLFKSFKIQVDQVEMKV